MEMDQINEYQILKNHGKAKYNPKSKQITQWPSQLQEDQGTPSFCMQP